MRNLFRKLVALLFPTPTGEREKMVSLLVKLRTRYTQFRLLSPDLQMEICSILDEAWRTLPERIKHELTKDQGVILEESDVVPLLDYLTIRKTNDDLQQLAMKYRGERDASVNENRELRLEIRILKGEDDEDFEVKEDTETTE